MSEIYTKERSHSLVDAHYTVEFRYHAAAIPQWVEYSQEYRFAWASQAHDKMEELRKGHTQDFELRVVYVEKRVVDA